MSGERLVDGLLPLSGRRDATRPLAAARADARRPRRGRPVAIPASLRPPVWRVAPCRPSSAATFSHGRRRIRTSPCSSTMVHRPAASLSSGPLPWSCWRPSRRDVLSAMTDELPSFFSATSRSDTRNVLLTLARMWMTASTGEVRPKDVAAAWASRLPEPCISRSCSAPGRATSVSSSIDGTTNAVHPWSTICQTIRPVARRRASPVAERAGVLVARYDGKRPRSVPVAALPAADASV